MSRFTVIYFILAVGTGILGFSGVVEGATYILKVLFYLFLILFLATFIVRKKDQENK